MILAVRIHIHAYCPHTYTRSVTPRRKTLRKLEFLLHFSDSDPSRVFYEMRRVWNLLISENTIKSNALAAKASVEIPADTSNPRILQSSTKRHTIFRLSTSLRNPIPSLNRFFQFLFWSHILLAKLKYEIFIEYSLVKFRNQYRF